MGEAQDGGVWGSGVPCLRQSKGQQAFLGNDVAAGKVGDGRGGEGGEELAGEGGNGGQGA